MSVHPEQIAVNLTMLQSFFRVKDVDGAYWTLALEIKFYVAVFIALLLGFRDYLKSIFIYWPIVFVVAFLLRLDYLPFLGKYYYFFCAGALFAILSNDKNLKSIFALLVVYFFCVGFSVANAIELSDQKGVYFSPLVVASIVSVFFLVFLYQNTDKGRSLRLPLSNIAGSVTYPIYLIHAHFGYMLLNNFASDNNKIFVYPLIFFLVFFVAVLINKFIERDLKNFWNKLFLISVGRLVGFFQFNK